jgi:hypothetical protein
MTELEGFAAYVGCVFGSCSMKVEASVNYRASGDLDRSEHNSSFNPARRGSTAWFDCVVQLRGSTARSSRTVLPRVVRGPAENRKDDNLRLHARS